MKSITVKEGPRFKLDNTRRVNLVFFNARRLIFNFFDISCSILLLLIYIKIYFITCRDADLDPLLSKLQQKII